MHALVQSVSSIVVALATAAFAHFGVTLKAEPCHCTKSEAVRHLSIAEGPSGDARIRRTPASPPQTVRQA